MIIIELERLAMLELLREYDVAKRFRKLKKSAPESIVAAPFWGKGALALLGIGGGQKFQIVCNLQSSACNPYVIEDLKNAQGVTVRSHPQLHAKIYATNKFAIIGSSNASSNGLAIEGQPESWIEANVISDDPTIVGSAFALFQEIWDSPTTSKITNAALTEAKKLWDNRPKQQPRVTATSLLAACREQPELFEAVYLAVYDEGLGPEGSRKLKDFKKSQRHPSTALNENDIRNAWGYQFEDMPEGAWLIDFDCIRKPIVHGYARITSPLVAFEADGEPDLVIAIKQRAIISDSLHSFKLSRSEKLAIIERAKLLVSQDDSLVPLKRVVQLIDGAA
jgi:hypothetical protein